MRLAGTQGLGLLCSTLSWGCTPLSVCVPCAICIASTTLSKGNEGRLAVAFSCWRSLLVISSCPPLEPAYLITSSLCTQHTGRQHTAVTGADKQHVVNKRWIRSGNHQKSSPLSSWNTHQTPSSSLLLPSAGDFMAPSYTESASAALLRDPETGGGQMRSEATGAGEENQPAGGT